MEKKKKPGHRRELKRSRTIVGVVKSLLLGQSSPRAAAFSMRSMSGEALVRGKPEGGPLERLRPSRPGNGGTCAFLNQQGFPAGPRSPCHLSRAHTGRYLVSWPSTGGGKSVGGLSVIGGRDGGLGRLAALIKAFCGGPAPGPGAGAKELPPHPPLP